MIATARWIRHALALTQPLAVLPLAITMVFAAPGRLLMSPVGLAVSLPSTLLSAALAAVGLAAVAGPADAEHDTAACRTAAQRQEEDDGHGRIVVFT